MIARSEITPLPTDPDIGLIHPPGTGLPIRYLPVPPCLLIQLRGVFLDPAVDRGVIDRHAPLGHHFLQIAVAHPVAAVPPHCPQNDVTGEMTTGEDTNGSDYFTSIFLLPQLCNSTIPRGLSAGRFLSIMVNRVLDATPVTMHKEARRRRRVATPDPTAVGESGIVHDTPVSE